MQGASCRNYRFSRFLVYFVGAAKHVGSGLWGFTRDPRFGHASFPHYADISMTPAIVVVGFPKRRCSPSPRLSQTWEVRP